MQPRPLPNRETTSFSQGSRNHQGSSIRLTVIEKSYASDSERSRRVRQMFAGIADRYDLLNHILSGNIDRRWRKRVARRLSTGLSGPTAIVLDLACGTGDLSLMISRETAATVIGTDFCRPMLEIAAGKTSRNDSRISYVEADGLSLPFLDSQFDAVTIAFGLRNFVNVEGGLREMLRVLKPGANLAVLEFSEPVIPGFREVFQFYFSRILPRIGGLIGGSRDAYEYLPDSVSRFPDQKRLAAMIISLGFESVSYENLSGGIAALHIATKPGV
jgi:demethylmenaquinone methyltransferase/2-methoxy-6-polyprenyl-1,4-benzoquinol methylase